MKLLKLIINMRSKKIVLGLIFTFILSANVCADQKTIDKNLGIITRYKGAYYPRLNFSVAKDQEVIKAFVRYARKIEITECVRTNLDYEDREMMLSHNLAYLINYKECVKLSKNLLATYRDDTTAKKKCKEEEKTFNKTAIKMRRILEANIVEPKSVEPVYDKRKFVVYGYDHVRVRVLESEIDKVKRMRDTVNSLNPLFRIYAFIKKVEYASWAYRPIAEAFAGCLVENYYEEGNG